MGLKGERLASSWSCMDRMVKKRLFWGGYLLKLYGLLLKKKGHLVMV